ncbi:MAG: CAP domain-containing protein [Candidatus Aminicenantes bacterium]|nr:CAP domain-containing protein [Candidatus Aminicenantes bacterium]
MKILLRICLSVGAALFVFPAAACDYFLNDVLPANFSELERRVFDRVNAKRAENGLEAVVWNDAIANLARSHSKDMAEGTVPFGHDGFDDRFASINLLIPASAGAENIAYASSADSAFNLWMDSAGHRDNILGDYDYTGVGVAWSTADGVYYFTEIFIRAR